MFAKPKYTRNPLVTNFIAGIFTVMCTNFFEEEKKNEPVARDSKLDSGHMAGHVPQLPFWELIQYMFFYI